MKITLMKTTLIMVFFIMAGCTANVPENTISKKTLFETINESKACKTITSGKQCDYRAGDYFKVSITAIGTDRTGIHFEKSDADQPIYASFATSHGCIIVNRFTGVKGMPEWVFISPKNGNVYNSWLECKAGT